MMQPTRDETHPAIGWLRAILTATTIIVVGIALLVYGTNAFVVKLHYGRPQRVAIATTFFFVVLFAMAWGLRWLQRRKLI
jgi:hypothetical protein